MSTYNYIYCMTCRAKVFVSTSNSNEIKDIDTPDLHRFLFEHRTSEYAECPNDPNFHELRFMNEHYEGYGEFHEG